MLIGLIAALGVSVFYTFSISSVAPLLKVIFAEHETLADWLDRSETQRRLGVVVAADIPDDPRGLLLEHVRPDSRSVKVLQNGDRITGIGGVAMSSFAVMRHITQHESKDLDAVTVTRADGTQVELKLRLRSYHWWSSLARSAAAWLPQGRDPASRLNTLGIVMGCLILVSLLSGLCRFMNEGMVGVAVQRAMHDLRTQLASHVMRLPIDWHSSQPPGDTLGRFATDIGKLEVGLTTLFGKVIREPMKAVGVFVLTLFIDWKLLVVALLGLPVGAVVIRVFGRAVKKAQKRASHSWGRLLDQLGEKLSGIRIVKAYNMQDAESRRFEGEGRQLTRAQSHIELVDAATNPALESLAVMGVAAFVMYGGSRVFAQDLEPHLFFAAVVCLGGLFDPVRKMGNVNNRLQQAEISAKRLFDLLDLPPEEIKPAASAAAPRSALQEAIEFENVTFAYPSNPQRPVLKGVNLRVEKGSVVALVGPNGSGKTTLVSLLLRFHQPTAGRVLIDGRDIADMPLDWLRTQIGLVTQDSVIFSGTVRENIAYGANGVSDEAIVKAARLAHVHEFVRDLVIETDHQTTTGYGARINSRTLSGGQRQRIAIARAILRDPPILILDEATSQIDSESERRIQEALEDVTAGRTTIVIAHRFSTIARADQIVVLNEGRVVTIGQHDELLQTCPFYVSLCQTQFALTG